MKSWAIAALVVAMLVVGWRFVGADAPVCGPGFARQGTRCCPARAEGDVCLATDTCPPPLVHGPRGCEAPPEIVAIPDTSFVLGPSDWEAEGRVPPRTVHAGPFRIDRFEVSVGRAHCPTCALPDAARYRGDPARAASAVTIAEARAYCAAAQGRLPREDEWLAAAAGAKPWRYPWGDTGAVCRRAAWGLVHGPCGSGAAGPDTVGAHPDGRTPLGVDDLAGNVAEWVETTVESAGVGSLAVARGGSFATTLATELRTWSRREVPGGTKDPTIGFRCAYDRLP